MMSKRSGVGGVVLIGLLLVALAVFVLFQNNREDSKHLESPVVPVEEATSGQGVVGGYAQAPRKSALSGEALEKLELPSDITEDFSGDHLKGYGSPDTTVEHDLLVLNDLLHDYISNVKVPEALSTWGNRYIVSALLGKNPHRARFLDPSFPFLNAEGELLDRWNSPLYFHFESSEFPEIRSAGPDQKLWTEDDVLSDGL